MQFSKTAWMANGWVTIDIKPEHERYFMPILNWLCGEYKIPMPQIIDTIDGYAADFELMGTQGMFWVDAWTFAIGFENLPVRDAVYDALSVLPKDFFDA